MSDILDIVVAAVDAARWAPSSHNCQPWLVRIGEPTDTGGRQVVIRLNDMARLTALESLDEEMAISLGLFTGLFCQALTHAGLGWHCAQILPETLCVTVGPLPAGRTDTGSAREAIEEFAVSLRTRRTSRASFHDRPLSPEQVAALLELRWPAPGIGRAARSELIVAPQSRAAVAELVAQFGNLDFSNVAAWSETYGHIHFRSARTVTEGRGFSIESLMQPMTMARRNILRLALHPVCMQLLPLGLPRAMARGLAQLTQEAPALLVLTAPKQNPGFFDLVETGYRLADIWLEANRQGLRLHPLSVLLQHRAPRDALRQALGMTEEPVFIARVGVPVSAPVPTPRVPITEILAVAKSANASAATMPISPKGI